MLSACSLGAILLRIQGFGVLTRIRDEIEAGRDPGRELAHGVMIMLAGILLLIPGFVTDIIGLLLFIPPVRDLAWRFLKDRVIVRGLDFGDLLRRLSRPRRGGKTIDLDEDEYSPHAQIRNRPGGSSGQRIDVLSDFAGPAACRLRRASPNLCCPARHASERAIFNSGRIAA